MSTSIINPFLPTLPQLFGVLALAATFFAFAIVGATVTGARRFSAVDIFTGWGTVTIIFVISGVFTAVNFSWLAYGLLGSSLPLAWYAIQRDRRHGIATACFDSVWRVLVLAAPFLLLIMAMRASQWDEFSHWLPNAQYLFRYDAFPQSGLPKSPSGFAGYPYGLPLITYLASRLVGSFVENAGAIFNLLLLFFHAVILSNVIALALQKDGSFRHNWNLLAICMLGVTILSTTFVQKIVLTSYADSTTSVVLAVIAVLTWKILDKLANESDTGALLEDIKILSWQCSLVIAVFLFLKQTNLVLLALLLAGASVVVIRDPAIRVIDALRLLPRILLPGAVVYFAWRYHLTQHIPQGEFSFRPMASWHVAEAFAVFLKMITIAAKKSPFFIMMLAISVFAIRGLMKFSGSRDRLFIPIAVVFLGFNFFLWLTYITAFGINDALRAGSFWRYNTQMGLLGVTGAAYGLALIWQKYASPALAARSGLAKMIAAPPVILVLVLPIALHHKLRFDIRPQKDHMRMVGQELATTLPSGTSIIVTDIKGDGFTGMVIRYELTSGPGAGRNIKMSLNLSSYSRITSPDQLNAFLKKATVTHTWVHQPLPLIETALKVKLAPYSSHLLRKSNGRWAVVKSWPYGGYKDPHSLPD